MVGRRRSQKRRLASTHQRSWLWGRHAVAELLTAGRWRPLELRLGRELAPELRRRIGAEAAAAHIPHAEYPGEDLTQWCGTAEHQGLLALMPPYPYLDLEAAIESARDPALFLVLDRIQDPYNFGAILRSAEVFGVDAVIVGEREQSAVTPHVARSSAGAVNHLNICQTSDLVEAITRLAALPGLLAVAAAGDGDRSAVETNLRRPCAIVIGNEGSGVTAPLRAACGEGIRIPQAGRVDSLNAAVAAGILLYEVRRQRADADHPLTIRSH